MIEAIGPAGIPLLAMAAVAMAGAAAATHGAKTSLHAMLLQDRPPKQGRVSISRLLHAAGRTSLARRLSAEQTLRRRLELCGREGQEAPIAGLKLCLGALGASVGVLLGGWPGALALAPLLGALGLRAPDVALARIAARRQAGIGSRVGDLVELLAAMTEAGLGPPVAIRRSATLLEGPLGDALQAAVRQLDLGVPWRVALHEVAERTDVAGLRRAVSLMDRSVRLGTPLRPVLRRLAEDLAAERRARAEERARRAPVTMLFPLVFLILPAFILLTVGPVLLATVRSLNSG